MYIVTLDSGSHLLLTYIKCIINFALFLFVKRESLLTELFHTNIKTNVILVCLMFREYGVAERNKPTLSS
jgi:hypothetical protein